MDARFNRAALIGRIQEIAKYKSQIVVYNKEIRSFISGVIPKYQTNAFAYFDPPYYENGQRLYKNFFSPTDHADIAHSIINGVNCPWVITYDDVPKLREIYSDFVQRRYNLNYSAANKGKGSEKQLSKIPKAMRDSLGNILKLPGEKSPEEMLYEYLLSLGSDHDFWSGGAQRVGFTWDYFNEHGPKSDDYKQEKDREKYKKWFIDHRQFFESTKLMDFWKKDNPQLVQKFREDFRIAHS